MLCIADVLTDAERARLVGLARPEDLVDGRETAGWHARQVKANQQARAGSDVARAADEIVRAALARSDLWRMAALPKTVGPILFNRYAGGGAYGDHVDDALMGAGEARLRTDLSFTLFLTSPDSYSGGALVVAGDAGEQSFKLPAGALVLYPASTLHRVEPVTEGERLACVGWCQSLVRDPARRQVLFDLDLARRAMFGAEGKTDAFDRVTKSYSNLMRMWAEP
jgi:PKHD-type hydroxylase